jgi:hypothetical protein
MVRNHRRTGFLTCQKCHDLQHATNDRLGNLSYIRTVPFFRRKGERNEKKARTHSGIREQLFPKKPRNSRENENSQSVRSRKTRKTTRYMFWNNSAKCENAGKTPCRNEADRRKEGKLFKRPSPPAPTNLRSVPALGRGENFSSPSAA